MPDARRAAVNHSDGPGLSARVSAFATNGETTMTIMVEIRAAEGGADARMLVLEQFKIYGKRCSRRCL